MSIVIEHCIMDVRVSDVRRVIDYSYNSPLANEKWESMQSLLMSSLLIVRCQYAMYEEYYYDTFECDMCLDVLFNEEKCNQ